MLEPDLQTCRHRSPSQLDAARIARLFDALAPEYDERFTGPIARAEDAAIARLLRPLAARLPAVGAGRLVCDLGCGTGLLLDLLPEVRDDRYLGYDLSSAMLTRAERKHPGYRFLHADIRIPLVGLYRQVGLLLSLFGSASYCPDPLAVVEAQLPALAVGGRCCFMLFAPAYRRRPSHIAPPSAIRTVTEREIRARLAPYRDLRFRILPFSPALDFPMTDRWPARARLVPALAPLASTWLALADRLGATALDPYFWIVLGVRER